MHLKLFHASVLATLAVLVVWLGNRARQDPGTKTSIAQIPMGVPVVWALQAFGYAIPDRPWSKAVSTGLFVTQMVVLALTLAMVLRARRKEGR